MRISLKPSDILEDAISDTRSGIGAANWNLLPDFDDRIAPALRSDFDRRYDLRLYDKMSRWFWGTSDPDHYQSPAERSNSGPLPLRIVRTTVRV